MSSVPDAPTTVRIPPYLQIEHEYGVIVCIEHRCAYTVDNIQEHLSRCHAVRNPWRKEVIDHIHASDISRTVRYPDDLSYPIRGLAILDGWQCNVVHCTKRSTSLELVQRHCSKKHNLISKAQRQEGDTISKILMQRWFAKGGRYWRITPRRTGVVLPSNPSSPALFPMSSPPALASTVLHHLAETVASQQQQARRFIQRSEHTAEISPWLRLCQYHVHFTSMDPELISTSYMVPSSVLQHGVLYYLHLSISRVLQSAYCQLKVLHHIDSRRLCSFEEGRLSNKVMQPLQEKASLTKYIRVFSGLACYFYRVTEEAHFEQERFQATAAQSSSLHALIAVIQELHEYVESHEIDVHIDYEQADAHLQRLFTRQDEATLKFLRELVEHSTTTGSFESVILSYCAAASWDMQNGVWMDENRCGSLLSSVIYCCQLVILADAFQRVEDDEFPNIGSAVKELTATWLVNTTRGPMCDLLRLRLYAMSVAQNVVHPGQFRWHSDNITLNFRDIKYRIPDLATEIEYYLTQARIILQDDLCLGVPDIPTFNLTDFHDNWESSRPGQSFLTDLRNASLLEPYQNWWITQVSASSSIYSMVVGSISDGDTVGEQVRSNFAIEFEKSVQNFLGFLAILIHKGSGQPGRSKEFLSLRLENKDTGRRNVFIHDGYFLFLLTYHKALHRTHASRFPVRFLLPEVGMLLMQFIVLIQPVRRLFCEAVCIPSQVSEYLWHNGSQIWTEAHLLQLAQSASSSAIGVPISMQAWRQMAVAIASKKFSGIEYQGDIDLPATDAAAEETPLTLQESLGGAMPDVFHLQAAHSAFTGRRIYGGATNYEGGLTDAALQEYFRASRLWHHLCRPQLTVSNTVHRRKADDRSSIAIDRPLLKRVALRQRPAQKIPCWSYEDVQFALRSMFPDKSRPAFRSRQQEALIHAITAGQPEIIGILATGEGKSLAFLLPSILPRAGMTVVVVPLVALKGDMQRRCEEAELEYAVWDSANTKVDYSGIPLVFVSVEQAIGVEFRAFLGQLDARRSLDRIVFDEAHLVLTASTYRPRMHLVQQLRAVYCQMVFLTATLPPMMQTQFEHKMLLATPHVIRSQTTRSDIRYCVFRNPKREFAAEFVKGVQAMLTDQTDDDSARNIVYTRTRDEADTLSEMLDCPKYYSDSGDHAEKHQAVMRWRAGDSKVIVATSAFGMGIDFPCVRCVFHYGPPREMIGFAQEVGRLSRDGQGGSSFVFLPHDWKASSLPVVIDQRRGSVADLAMSVYLDNPRCLYAVLSRFLDGPEGMTYCTAPDSDDRCLRCSDLGLFDPAVDLDPTIWWDLQSGQGAEFDEAVSFDSEEDDPFPPGISEEDRLITIPPTQSSVPVLTGGYARLRTKIAADAVGYARYVSCLNTFKGRCMICTLLSAGMISAEQQWHSFNDCQNIGRHEYRNAKTAAIQRQRSCGGWIKSYIACFRCGQPQKICRVGEDEAGQVVSPAPYLCAYRDLAFTAGWALFHSATRFGRTLGEISGAPTTVWDTEEHWMNWLGTECDLYGMRACQAARMLDWIMNIELPI